ncbi:MAG: hypothetical protein Ct9H300mP1_08050 [Planctomycetaceae bacterium]|nr:MAG: hypothetical protein Ct9H300mP1_08050 [Planctomycetaceae bacterium]
MGQKVRPTGFRVGVVEDWRSRWYASKREFGDLLIEDHKIRSFVKEKYNFALISRIEIERTRDFVVVHLHTARPGIIIGRKGQEVERLEGELEKLTGRRMELKIVEINDPQRNAVLGGPRTWRLSSRNGGVFGGRSSGRLTRSWNRVSRESRSRFPDDSVVPRCPGPKKPVVARSRFRLCKDTLNMDSQWPRPPKERLG